jgi:uncharacterized protein YndB with AHSA1/START domain
VRAGRDESRGSMADAGAKVSLPSDHTILIVRAFSAPCAAVFDAWTRPEQVTEWWDPRRQPLAACEIDLSPNGRFRFVTQGPDGAAHPFTGRYREIVPPSRLVFTTQTSLNGPSSIGTLIFEEHGGTTTLTMTIECASKADRDTLLKMRVDAGTMRTLANLAHYLGRR